MIEHIKSDWQKWRKKKIKILKIFLIFLILAGFLIFLSSKISNKFSWSWDYSFEKEIESTEFFSPEIIFNNELNTKIFEETLLKEIELAKKSIDVAIFSMDMPNVIEALIQKSRLGLDVTVIMPNSEKNVGQKSLKDTEVNLILSGDPVLLSNENRGDIEELMHHKFVIIDAGRDTQKLITGPTNFTILQQKFDPGFLMVLNNPEIIEIYKIEFENLHKGIRGTEKVRKIGSPLSRKINYKNGFVEIWMGPGISENSLKTRIIELIESADKNIKVMVWYFNDRVIGDALRRAAIRGVNVKILFDDYLLEEQDLARGLIEFDKNTNFPLVAIEDGKRQELLKPFADELSIIDDFNTFLHHHTMIIDDEIVLTGTANWTYNGFFRNDENILVTNVPEVVERFGQNFEFHFDYLK